MTTVSSIGVTILLTMLGYGLSLAIQLPTRLIVSAMSILIWPCWFKVFNSAATAGSSSEQWTEMLMTMGEFDNPWYNTKLFLFGFELALIGLFVFFITQYKLTKRGL